MESPVRTPELQVGNACAAIKQAVIKRAYTGVTMGATRPHSRMSQGASRLPSRRGLWRVASARMLCWRYHIGPAAGSISVR